MIAILIFMAGIAGIIAWWMAGSGSLQSHGWKWGWQAMHRRCRDRRRQ